MPAHLFEKYLWGWTNLVPGKRTLNDWVRLGKLPKAFAGNDPNRLVPVVTKPEHVMIAVSGDPLRSNCYLFVHNGMLGFPTTKTVQLPAGAGGASCAPSRHEPASMSDADSLWIVLPAGPAGRRRLDRRHAQAARGRAGSLRQGAARRASSRASASRSCAAQRRGARAGAVPASRLERRPARRAADRRTREGRARLHRSRRQRRAGRGRAIEGAGDGREGRRQRRHGGLPARVPAGRAGRRRCACSIPTSTCAACRPPTRT